MIDIKLRNETTTDRPLPFFAPSTYLRACFLDFFVRRDWDTTGVEYNTWTALVRLSARYRLGSLPLQLVGELASKRGLLAREWHPHRHP